VLELIDVESCSAKEDMERENSLFPFNKINQCMDIEVSEVS